MFTRLISVIFGAGIGFAVAAVPAYAADDIEAKRRPARLVTARNGVPIEPKTIPIIWGQQQSYLMKQLHDYRSGDRDNPIMTPIAKACAGRASQARGLFRGQELACAKRSGTSAPLPNGIASASHAISRILRAGRRRRGCGLSYEYLVASMRGFATDERSNNGDMRNSCMH